jgi:hypothetical protein
MPKKIASQSTEETVRKILSEEILTLKQAAVEIKNLTGQKPDRATLHRWVLRGVGGVKLEACRIGPVLAHIDASYEPLLL